MIHALIDTDILIDGCFNRQPFADDSIQILKLCEVGEIYGFSTPLLLSNFYYLLRKINPHQQTIAIVSKITQILTIMPVTAESVLQAIESPFKDFEDALQYHSCLEQGNIQLIVTRNKKDYQNSAIAVMTPTELLAHLAQNPPNHPIAGR